MKRFTPFLLAFAFFASACAPAYTADPPAQPPVKKADPAPAAPVVILPADNPPAPLPTPLPKTPTKLLAGVLFVIQCSVDCDVVDGTEGMVTIEAMAGPVTVYGTYVDSSGPEKRTLTQPFIWIVRAAGVGKTDLIITPTGGKRVRVCLAVDNGQPVPPPGPGPGPQPANPLTVTFQTAYVLDTDADRAKSLAFLQEAYKTLASLAPSQTTLKTNADAVAWMKTLVSAPNVGLTPMQLVNTRKAIGAELSAAWGAAIAPLDNATMTAELTKISTALNGVK